MLIAGEASGDVHAAGLVEALRPRLTALMGARRPPVSGEASGGSGRAVSGEGSPSQHSDMIDVPAEEDLQPLRVPLAPRFFGAGGPHMAAAGVEVQVELASHAVFGLTEVVRELRKFRRFLRRLIELACRRQPDLIVLVDSAGFNRRFAAAIRRRVAARRGPFFNWSPKIVYYISPQVWASREGRAYQLARDVDLLLSIFPFEQEWYARRVPQLRVEFVGHPAGDRYAGWQRESPTGEGVRILLLPGSRVQEVRRHLPVMAEAIRLLSREVPVRACMTFPNDRLLSLAASLCPVRRGEGWPVAQAKPGDGRPLVGCAGRLPELLSGADLALAKSGSVTLECAWFRVPAVVIYRVAWPTWIIARWLVRVPHVAMPNLLAGKRVYPELLQSAATPEAIAREALDLLRNERRRREMEVDLDRVLRSLGESGAYHRAADAIIRLLTERVG
jgi:lipid-A-disaccharide synthase